MRFGFLELVVLLAIVLLAVGPKQLPKLTAAINDSVKSFRKELGGESKENSESCDEEKE